MSEAIALDTHRFVKHLTENGFTEQQAEVLADEQVNLLNTNLATQTEVAAIRRETAAIQREIEVLRQETKAGIEALRQETKASIAEVKSDLIKWMVRALIAQGGVIVTLLSGVIVALLKFLLPG